MKSHSSAFRRDIVEDSDSAMSCIFRRSGLELFRRATENAMRPETQDDFRTPVVRIHGPGIFLKGVGAENC
jgi:hypothetical protein